MFYVNDIQIGEITDVVFHHWFSRNTDVKKEEINEEYIKYTWMLR